MEISAKQNKKKNFIKIGKINVKNKRKNQKIEMMLNAGF